MYACELGGSFAGGSPSLAIYIYLHRPNGVSFCFFSNNCFLAETMCFFPTTFFLLNPQCGPFWGVMLFFFFSKKKNRRFETATFANQTATFPDPKAFFCRPAVLDEISDPCFYR